MSYLPKQNTVKKKKKRKYNVFCFNSCPPNLFCFHLQCVCMCLLGRNFSFKIVRAYDRQETETLGGWRERSGGREKWSGVMEGEGVFYEYRKGGGVGS